VKNSGEFHPWAVESILLPNGMVLSALDALLHVWNDQIMTRMTTMTTTTAADTTTDTSKTDTNTTATAPMPMATVLPQKVLYAISACLRGNPLAQHVFHQSQYQPTTQFLTTLHETNTDTVHGRKHVLRLLQLGHDLLVEWNTALSLLLKDNDTEDTSSSRGSSTEDDIVVIRTYIQAWTTPAWCQVVLDKIQIAVTESDKRLPLLHVWYPYCQGTTWSKENVSKLLGNKPSASDDNNNQNEHNAEAVEEDSDTQRLRNQLQKQILQEEL
jgi:hypothetical protein